MERLNKTCLECKNNFEYAENEDEQIVKGYAIKDYFAGNVVGVKCFCSETCLRAGQGKKLPFSELRSYVCDSKGNIVERRIKQIENVDGKSNFLV